MNAMQRLMKDRTTFMIAHRLCTLDNCDGSLLIEGGCILGISTARAKGFEDLMMDGPRVDESAAAGAGR